MTQESKKHLDIRSVETVNATSLAESVILNSVVLVLIPTKRETQEKS